jgi:hypothetical protein
MSTAQQERVVDNDAKQLERTADRDGRRQKKRYEGEEASGAQRQRSTKKN